MCPGQTTSGEGGWATGQGEGRTSEYFLQVYYLPTTNVFVKVRCKGNNGPKQIEGWDGVTDAT